MVNTTLSEQHVQAARPGRANDTVRSSFSRTGGVEGHALRLPANPSLPESTAGASARRRWQIAYLCPVGEVGGAEISMLDLISHIDRNDFSVTSILMNGGKLEERLKELDVSYRICRLPRLMRTLSRARRPSLTQLLLLPLLFLWSVVKLRRLLQREKADVVVSNGIKCHVLSALALLNTKARLVWHVRDVLAPGLVRWCLQVMARLSCSLVITNSYSVAETIPTTRTITIHNGIDLSAFHPEVAPFDKQKDLHLPSDAVVLGTVGHLAPVKGLDILIEAVPLILAEVPEAHLLIAGDAIYETHEQYAQQLTDRVERHGLAERVHFLGFVRDIPRLLAGLDIFVLASRCEGFGRAVAEALAVGCPVVATQVGGICELVSSEVHGLLVPPGRPEPLAAGVVKLISDPSLRERLTEHGKRRVWRHFGVTSHTRRFQAALRSILPARSVHDAGRPTCQAAHV